MYLNAPKEGGGTAFPNIGLTVTAKKGSAVYFENVDLNGHVDTQTLHAGLPVLAGEKWIATKWLRERALF
jgi:prolyl 4-hydroxylase